MSERQFPDRGGGNPWISSSGEAAHPASPKGGGGPGLFSNPGSLADHNNLSGLPHPQSPSARRVLPGDVVGVLLAQKETGSGKKGQVAALPVRPVKLQEFNNKGPAKYVAAIKGNLMGVHPKGNFPWVNAVELIFAIDAKAAGKLGIKEYRAQQKVFTQELWQRELKDGEIAPWTKLIATGEEPDNPDDGLQTIASPVFAYHDAPGFMASTKDLQFKGPAQKMTSEKAVYIFMRQNFIGWVEATKGSGKRKEWQQVSDDVKWHSNQSLARNIFSKTEPWLAGEGSEIELGHTEGQPK